MENKEEVEDYGEITIGYGTAKEGKLKIKDFISANYLDNRKVDIIGVEDGSVVLQIENYPGSGRSPKQNMRVSQESFAALVFTINLYLRAKNTDINDFLKSAVPDDSGRVTYSCSDNLKPKDNEEKENK